MPATKSTAARALLVLRVLVPVFILGIVFIARDKIVDLLNSFMGLGYIFTVVHIYSTLTMRLLITCAICLGLTLVWFGLSMVNKDRARILIYTSLSALLLMLIIWYFRSLETGTALAILSAVLILGNSLPWLPNSKTINAGFWGFFGIEFAFPRLYLQWVKEKCGIAGRKGASVFWRIMPGSVLAAIACAMLLPTPVLMHLGNEVFMTRHASIIFGPEYTVWSRYDVSDIARDPSNGDIYLCGDSQISPKVLRTGLGPAEDIGVSNSGNEFCEFSIPSSHFLTTDNKTGDFLVIDTETAGLISRLPLPDLPEGELLMAAHPVLNMAVIASENENNVDHGVTIRVVDLETSEVIRKIDDDVGFIILHPTHPVLYINHFAQNLGVRAYNMETGTKLANSVKFGRSDRMTFDMNRDEVLATAPEFGQIWRFDATTLEAKVPIDTVFGVRGLAVDHERDLLLTSSFLTNKVDVIDLKTGRSLRRYRLGPWMRDIHVVSEEGIAYVASRYGLYRLNYLE